MGSILVGWLCLHLVASPLLAQNDSAVKQHASKPAAQEKKVDDKAAKDEAEKLMKQLEERIQQQKTELDLLKLFAKSLAEIEKSYVEKVDRRRLIEAAIDGMLHELDRHSDYIPPQETKEFETDIESKYGGIGIRVTRFPDDQYLTVATPILNSPALKAGVQAGTWITQISDQDAKGMTIDEAIEAIQGEIGTSVKITFRDKTSGRDKTLFIERSIVQVQTVLGDRRLPSHQWNYLLDYPESTDEKIGYIRITSFGRQTSQELRDVMLDLVSKKVEGLIIDLRFNPGGLLASAVNVADLFVDSGLIVRIEGRNTIPRRWMAKKAGTLEDFPIAVIVNDRSASASEIVAACFKDSGRAVIVGERTFGKGSVQDIIKLESGKSLMKLTTAAYYRPNGKNIDRSPDQKEEDTWGVKPTPGYAVEMDENQQRKYFEYRQNRDVIWSDPQKAPPEKEFNDLQLDKAVKYIRRALKKRQPNSNLKGPGNQEKR